MIFAVKSHSFLDTLEDIQTWIKIFRGPKIKTLRVYLFRNIGFIEDRKSNEDKHQHQFKFWRM